MDIVVEGSRVFGKLDVAAYDMGVTLNSIDRAVFVSRDVGGSVLGQEMDQLWTCQQSGTETYVLDAILLTRCSSSELIVEPVKMVNVTS